MIVCSCHHVSRREIRAAIEAGARTEDEVGDRCDAGTNCGGCLDSIRRLLERQAEPAHHHGLRGLLHRA